MFSRISACAKSLSKVKNVFFSSVCLVVQSKVRFVYRSSQFTLAVNSEVNSIAI